MESFKSELGVLISQLSSIPPQEGGAALLLIILTCLMIYAGAPIAFSLFGTAAIFAGFALVSGEMSTSAFSPFAQHLEDLFSSPVLIAIPLLLFTALIIERGYVVEGLFEKFINHWKQKSEAMLFTVSLVDILISIFAATVCLLLAPLGALRLPLVLKSKNHELLNKEKIKRLFKKGPLSHPGFMSLPIMFVLVADQLNKINPELNSLSSEQDLKSKELLVSLSVIDLITAALIPSLILLVLYGVYQLALLFKYPNDFAYKNSEKENNLNQTTKTDLLKALFPPALYIISLLIALIAVKLSIVEVASLAAIGALFLVAHKRAPQKNKIYLYSLISFLCLCVLSQVSQHDIANFKLTPWSGAALAATLFFIGGLTFGLFHLVKELIASQADIENKGKPFAAKSFMEEVLREAYTQSIKVITLLIAASFFILIFKALGGDALIKTFLQTFAEVNGFVLTAALLAIILTAVLFSSYVAVLVALPILAPHIFVLTNLHSKSESLIWLGILIIISLQATMYWFLPKVKQTSKEESQVAVDALHEQIAETKIPFITIHIIIIILICLFPWLVSWLKTII